MHWRQKVETTAARVQPLPASLAAAAGLLGWAVCIFQWRRAKSLRRALRKLELRAAADAEAIQALQATAGQASATDAATQVLVKLCPLLLCVATL